MLIILPAWFNDSYYTRVHFYSFHCSLIICFLSGPIESTSLWFQGISKWFYIYNTYNNVILNSLN